MSDNTKDFIKIINFLFSICAIIISISTCSSQKNRDDFKETPSFMNVVEMKQDADKQLVSYKLVNESEIKLKEFVSEDLRFILETQSKSYDTGFDYIYNFYPINNRFVDQYYLSGYTRDVIKTTEMSPYLYSTVSYGTAFANGLGWMRNDVYSSVLNELIVMSKITYKTYDSNIKQTKFIVSTRFVNFEIEEFTYNIFKDKYVGDVKEHKYGLNTASNKNIYEQLSNELLKDEKELTKKFEIERSSKLEIRTEWNNIGRRISLAKPSAENVNNKTE